MKILHKVSWVLVIIGGLNWLLVGLFSWDIGMIFGGQGVIVSRIIYILVGLSAIYLIVGCKNVANVRLKIFHNNHNHKHKIFYK